MQTHHSCILKTELIHIYTIATKIQKSFIFKMIVSEFVISPEANVILNLNDLDFD